VSAVLHAGNIKIPLVSEESESTDSLLNVYGRYCNPRARRRSAVRWPGVRETCGQSSQDKGKQQYLRTKSVHGSSPDWLLVRIDFCCHG
jgi:hypothetical protein